MIEIAPPLLMGEREKENQGRRETRTWKSLLIVRIYPKAFCLALYFE